MSRRDVLPPIAGHNRTMVTPHYAVMPPGSWRAACPAREDSVRHTSRQWVRTSPRRCWTSAAARAAERWTGHFFFVVEEAEIAADGRRRLDAGGYVAAGRSYSMRRGQVIWIRRPYVAAPGIAPRTSFFGHRRDACG